MTDICLPIIGFVALLVAVYCVITNIRLDRLEKRLPPPKAGFKGDKITPIDGDYYE